MSTPAQAARRQATRRRICAALLTLLRRAPIEAISVKEVCALAGVSRGTFYGHFADVYDLLGQIEEEMTADIAAVLEPLVDAEALAVPAAPAAVLAQVFSILRQNADLCTVILGPYGDMAFADRLIQLGRAGFVRMYRDSFGRIPAEAADYCYRFLSGGIVSLLRQWLADGTAVPPEDMARLAEALLLRGASAFPSGEIHEQTPSGASDF